MQNAPWLVGQNIHMCKKDPELLGGINMYKVHPGLLGRIYTFIVFLEGTVTNPAI